MKPSEWILLVEDDAPLAELAKMVFAKDGLAQNVVLAGDGLEALDCLNHRGDFLARPVGDPMLVLLDLKMPKVDGLEVLRQIKSNDRLRAIPVVMFTSSRDPTDVNRSYRLGANAYVVKPSGFQEFSTTIKCIAKFWGGMNETTVAINASPETAEFNSPRLSSAS